VNKVARGCLSVFLILAALVVVMVAGKIAGILLLVAGGYVLSVLAKAMPSLSGYAGLAANGIPARGILLQVNPVATSLQGGQIKVRQVLVDVEVPGQASYEVSVSAMMPTNLSADVIPGATMELRLHPKNRTTIAIVGPGVGFAGGSLLAPGYAGGGPGGPGGSAGGGMS
jgi:hypothetical protein